MTNGLDFGLTQILFTTKVFFLTVIPAQAGIQTCPFGNRGRKKFLHPDVLDSCPRGNDGREAQNSTIGSAE